MLCFNGTSQASDTLVMSFVRSRSRRSFSFSVLSLLSCWDDIFLAVFLFLFFFFFFFFFAFKIKKTAFFYI